MQCLNRAVGGATLGADEQEVADIAVASLWPLTMPPSPLASGDLVLGAALHKSARSAGVDLGKEDGANNPRT